MNSDFPSRLGFLRNRFPNIDSDRHSWAMNVFSVASRHVLFRNILAHSPIIISENEDGSRRILGVLDLTPKDPANVGQLVCFEELRGRVDEPAQLGSKFLEMRAAFK